MLRPPLQPRSRRSWRTSTTPLPNSVAGRGGPMADPTRAVTLPITGMTCANCVATIERGLRRLDGVELANVNLASERASVEFDPSRLAIPALVDRIRSAGYDVALGEVSLLLARV